MNDRKLYALTDQDVEVLRELLHGPLIAMTFTGGPNVDALASAAAALNPLEVSGDAAEALEGTLREHMAVETTEAGWACTACGHTYPEVVSHPIVWAHAFATTLAALMRGDQ